MLASTVGPYLGLLLCQSMPFNTYSLQLQQSRDIKVHLHQVDGHFQVVSCVTLRFNLYRLESVSWPAARASVQLAACSLQLAA